jgi:hypothetical protein
MKPLILLPMLLMTSTAMAQDAAAPPVNASQNYVRAKAILDNPIYTTSGVEAGVWDFGTSVDDFAENFTEIGEIEDMIVDAEGKVIGVVAEIGGLLDIGDKHVLMQLTELRVVMADGEPYYVTTLSEEQLEQREGIDADWWR